MKDIPEVVALAIVGLIGAIALWKLGPEGTEVAATCAGGIVGYLTKAVTNTQ